MTASSEPRSRGSYLDASWRADAERAQEAAMPAGRVVASCAAPFGIGGLGRHLQEIVAALDRRGQPRVCLSGATASPPPGAELRQLPAGALERTLAPRLLGPSPAWRARAACEAFDRRAARALPDADHLIAFNGQALAQFAAAQRRGWESVSLVAANSHLKHLLRQHARAHSQYPLERSWATRLLERNRREYALAERIYVASRYIWESFVREGVSEDRLVSLPLTPDPRYAPGDAPTASSTFDVVYVGSLTVAKGVPLLVEAFGRLAHADMRLVLVGGWGTRGMRRFMQQACARDRRISIRPGDPLPHLRAARLYVHASYEDGFAYAPAEALACGVPVIVSADTGMKELVESGGGGVIVPTGDVDALAQAIGAAYAGEIPNG